MSIPISVDEAAAFDMYSILRVKLARSVSPTLLESIALMQTEIKRSIGASLFIHVLESTQYGNLIEVNDQLFTLIDEIKKRGPQMDDAVSVDKLNYERYACKRAIQEAFFKTPLSEVKLGYSKP